MGTGVGTRWALLAVTAQLESDLQSDCSFQHKTPEDPAEVPGGFLSDLNLVGSWGSWDMG